MCGGWLDVVGNQLCAGESGAPSLRRESSPEPENWWLDELPSATIDAGEGTVWVGMPTVDDELRCVFAGAGVTSLEPDEFTSVIELLFTRATIAGTRIVREDALIETERDLLPLLF